MTQGCPFICRGCAEICASKSVMQSSGSPFKVPFGSLPKPSKSVEDKHWDSCHDVGWVPVVPMFGAGSPG